jgi:hypothetical protein
LLAYSHNVNIYIDSKSQFPTVYGSADYQFQTTFTIVSANLLIKIAMKKKKTTFLYFKYLLF